MSAQENVLPLPGQPAPESFEGSRVTAYRGALTKASNVSLHPQAPLHTGELLRLVIDVRVGEVSFPPEAPPKDGTVAWTPTVTRHHELEVLNVEVYDPDGAA